MERERSAAAAMVGLPGFVVLAVSDNDGEYAQAVETTADLDASTAVGWRDRAVLTVLAWLGLRRAEAATLELADVNWHSGEILVRGKGARSSGFRCRSRSARPWPPI